MLKALGVDVCLLQELGFTQTQVRNFNERNPDFYLVVDFVEGNDLISEDIGFLVKTGICVELIKSNISRLSFIKLMPEKRGAIPLVLANAHGPNTDKGNWWTMAMQECSRVEVEHALHLLGGDFNVCLHVEDRRPEVRLGVGNVQLRNLLESFNLTDIYRSTRPDEVDFTHLHITKDGTTSRGRIDRLYGIDLLKDQCRTWETIPSGESDHSLIVATFTQNLLKKSKQAVPRLSTGTLQCPQVLDIIKNIIQESLTWEDITAKLSKKIPQLNLLRAKRLHSRIKTLLTRRRKRVQKKLRTNEVDKEIADLFTSSFHISEKTERILKAKLGQGYLLLKPPRGAMKVVKSQTISSLRSSTGESTTSVAGMGVIAQSFYQELYQKLDPTVDDMSSAILALKLEKDVIILTELEQSRFDNLIAPFTSVELASSIANLKTGTSPGPDGIPNDLFKLFEEELTTKLLTEFNSVLAGTKELAGAKKGIITLLFKKGDNQSLGNYRPITLLNTGYKLFTAMLSARLAEAVNPLVHKSQHAFIKGRRIFDAIYEAQTFIYEGKQNKKVEAALLLLDQAKAYDKTSQVFMYEVLTIMRVPQGAIELIKTLYQGFKANVMLNGSLSPDIDIRQGVKQGDPLSCILFVIIMESLGALLRTSSGNENIATLFADDTTIYVDCLRTDWPELQKPLNDFCKASKAVFNSSKTEVILLGEKRDDYPADLPAPVLKGTSVRCLGAPIGLDLNYSLIAKSRLEELLRHARGINLTGLSIRERRRVMSVWIYPKLVFLLKCMPFDKKLLTDFDSKIHALTFKDRKLPFETLETLSLSVKDGGMGGTNARQLSDMMHFAIAGELIDVHERKPVLWETRLLRIWEGFAISKVTSTHPLKREAMGEGSIHKLLANPLLQTIKEVGIMQGTWPPIFTSVLKTWNNANVTLNIDHGLNVRSLPFAWSNVSPSGSTRSWSNVNVLLKQSDIRTWGDFADCLNALGNDPLMRVCSTELLLKVEDFFWESATAKKAIRAAEIIQVRPTPTKMVVSLKVKRVRGGDTPSSTISPFGSNGNREYALARVTNTPKSGKQWEFLWKIKLEPKELELMYRIKRNTLRVGARMPNAVDNLCPHCRGEETLMHTLQFCPSLVPLFERVKRWAVNSINIELDNDMDPIDNLCMKVPKESAVAWTVGYGKYLSVIWKRRNQKKYMDKITSTADLIAIWEESTKSRLLDLGIETGRWFAPADGLEVAGPVER